MHTAHVAARTVADLLATGEPLALPGVYDALGAALAARAGFRAVFLSGYALSATRLARPDVGLLTQTEVLDAARRMCAAVDVPLIVDADTGYGDAGNVERTVRELVQAGAAGCFLEDQVWPKRCGHMEGKQVVPLEEYLEKLARRAARRAAPGFHVTARTDARAPLGLDEAIRARARVRRGRAPTPCSSRRRARRTRWPRCARRVPPEVPLVANMVEGGKTPRRTVARAAPPRASASSCCRSPGLLAATHALGEAVRDASPATASSRDARAAACWSSTP